MEAARAYEPVDPFWVSNSSPPFNGSKEEDINEDYDMWVGKAEKKRRLSPHQVKFLEKSFEIENKLEPERKLHLAKEIGLQPRQVAIWFQNRRARYKTKQLEKDYSVLKASFDKLNAEYTTLSKENESLRNEVHLLEEKLRGKENTEHMDSMEGKCNCNCKQEDAKSDIDSESSPLNKSCFLDHSSDFSQEDDTLSGALLIFPKLEHVNSSNFGFQIEDQSWFSHY